MSLGFHPVPWRSCCFFSIQRTTLGRKLRWWKCGRSVGSHTQPCRQFLKIPHTLIESFRCGQYRRHVLFDIDQYPGLHSGSGCRTAICFLVRSDSYVSFPPPIILVVRIYPHLFITVSFLYPLSVPTDFTIPWSTF